jgi:hypothetical protein
MTVHVPLYAGAVVSILWGAAHVLPTKGVVAGFEPLSRDHRLVLVMEWVAEGLTLVFLGVLALLVTALAGPTAAGAGVAYRVSAGMLLVMALWTAVTGGRTRVVFFKICPFVKTLIAGLFLVGSLA